MILYPPLIVLEIKVKIKIEMGLNLYVYHDLQKTQGEYKVMKKLYRRLIRFCKVLCTLFCKIFSADESSLSKVHWYITANLIETSTPSNCCIKVDFFFQCSTDE